MSDNITFPFVINGFREEDNAKTFFLSMAEFDVTTLLRLRLVSKEWRDAIDSIYGKKLWGQQSLMRAVRDNRLDICQLILEHAQNKNPRSHYGYHVEQKHPIDVWGNTPLHCAAIFGHLDICSLIIDQVEDKNPKGGYNYTPLHEAARFGHLDICQLIIDQVEEKSPMDYVGNTPLDLAAKNGHSDICQLIKSRIEDQDK